MQRPLVRSSHAMALGQHRLRDSAAVRIVASTGLAPPQLVFDLGAGDGQLTAALLSRYAKVVAVELDRAMWVQLKHRFRDEPRVNAVLGDLLAVELPARTPYKIIANVPYGVTARLMRRLLTLDHPPAEAFLVLQREAATKWAGVGHDTQASILLKNVYVVDVVLALQRSDFLPRPGSDSVLVSLNHRPRAVFAGRERVAFESFVRRGFGDGRTTLLRNLGKPTDRQQFLDVLKAAGLDAEARPHEAIFNVWADLFRLSQQRRRHR